MSEEPRKIGADTPAYGYEVAAAFRECAAMFTAAKAAGYRPLYGRKTTLRHYAEWRANHPEFSSTAYVAAHSKTVRQRLQAQQERGRAHSQRPRGRPGAIAGKSDAQ